VIIFFFVPVDNIAIILGQYYCQKRTTEKMMDNPLQKIKKMKKNKGKEN
jgi:hypothetical protein